MNATPLNTISLLGHKKKRLLFSRLPIQRRLPLFIFILLITVITTFSWISYVGVKRSSEAMAIERVTTLADKLSSIFKQSIDNFAASAKTMADQKNVIHYLSSGKRQDSVEALSFLNTYERKDTSNKLVQLLNAKKQVMLTWTSDKTNFYTNIDQSNRALTGQNGYVSVGKLVSIKNLMYFPVIASVRNNNKTIGYIVNWKILHATQQSIDQLAQLLGGNGRVYFGNDDNSFWTNLLNPVEKPPVSLKTLERTARYSRNNGGDLIGSLRPLANSRWLVLIELSDAATLKTAHIFLGWVIIIGTVLVILGALGGWIMSRNLTAPLSQLGNAASSLAEGNHLLIVDYNRQDEIGKLAESFNIMAAKVEAAKRDLEQKVEDRTQELRTAQTDIKNEQENLRKKDEFISVASHELKTPLTTIKTFFQIAEKEIPTEYKLSNLIHRASRQVNRMEHLISDLLDVSKITSNNIQYSNVVFDLDLVLREAVNCVQQISPTHKLLITRSVSVKITGDPIRMEQAITNLLNNAVKFSPGAPEVLISSEIEGGSVRIKIQDFGIGIEKDAINALFEKFSRVNIDPRFQGLGLGLFISSEIIKRYGGTISVQSELGKGSEFIIRLPMGLYN